MTIVNKKLCNRCKEEKDLSEFYSQKKISKKKGEYIYYHPECKECTKKASDKWSKENKDKRSISNAKYHKTDNGKEKKRLADERRKKRGWMLTWQRSNTDKIRNYNKNRVENKTHTITEKEWEECKKYFNHRCAYCGLPIEEHYKMWRGDLKYIDLHKEHIDHQGSNDLSNCVPSCQSCNSSKWIYDINEWYNENNENFSLERLERIHNWLNEDYKKYLR